MKIGRRTRGPAIVLGLATFGLLLAGVAQAQDEGLGKLLKEAAALHRQGKSKEANAKARAVLAANPSSEDAYSLVRATDTQVFLELLKAGGDSEQVATRLLRLSHPIEMERSQDETAIRGLVNKAIDPNAALDDRVSAARELAAKHGEYAVPMLVEVMGSNDTVQRANAILALTRIGTDGVTALAASLGTGNGTQQKNTAMLLQRIGDERSAPALMRFAGKAGAANAYVALAKSYFQGDPQSLKNYDGTYSVWSANGGKLVKQDVPRFLYRYEMAEQACYDALAADPASGDARALIALCALAEISAYNHLGDDVRELENVKGAAKALEGARGLAASAGTTDLLNALSMASAMGHGSAAALVCDAIPGSWDGRAIDAKNAMVMGLDSSDKTIRYACAIALLNLDPAKSFPKSKQVAKIAGDAAGESAIKQVLVIDSDRKNASNVQRALNSAGMHAVSANTGAGGLLMAKFAGGFDLVLVRNRLADITTFQVLDEINRDVRTQHMKKVVMATDADMGEAKKDYDKRGVSAYSPTSGDLKGMVSAVTGVLNADAGDWPAQRANALSQRASNAVAGSRGGGIALAGAEGGLMNAVSTGKSDDVRLAALGALANMASSKAQSGLASVVARTENSAAIRAAACSAMGTSLRGSSPGRDAYDALLAAMGDADVSVRTAAGAALGAAKLTEEQRSEVMQKRRVN